METKMDDQNNQTVETKRIHRSKIDRIIAGVCGGVAEYFDIDATIVRVIWLFTFFFGGFGVLLYLACLVIMKENPEQNASDQKKPQNTGLFWGIALVLFGFSLISSNWHWRFFHFRPFHWNLFNPWFFNWDRFWPVVIILLGLFYLIYVLKQNKEGEDTASAPKSKLFRSRNEKVIGGVCGGIAKNLHVDPVFVRIGWVILTLFTKIFLGIIVYILWMVIVSEEPVVEKVSSGEPATAPEPEKEPVKKNPKRVKRMPKKKKEPESDSDSDSKMDDDANIDEESKE